MAVQSDWSKSKVCAPTVRHTMSGDALVLQVRTRSLRRLACRAHSVGLAVRYASPPLLLWHSMRPKRSVVTVVVTVEVTVEATVEDEFADYLEEDSEKEEERQQNN